MFERKLTSSNKENTPAQSVICLFSQSGEPVEFIYNGVRFHINERLTTWLETNDWWKKLEVWKFYKPLNYIASRNKQDDRPIIYDLLPRVVVVRGPVRSMCVRSHGIVGA